MLLRREVLAGIRRGTISLAFRRWKRPTVRSGGTLLTAAGQLQIAAVTAVSSAAITEEDAARAGYPSRKALLAELERRDDGQLYRIELGSLGPDPRVALRESRVGQDGITALRNRLGRLDARSADGPWTTGTLELIRRRPGVRAVDLAKEIGQDRDRFKRNVRKLKSLGLTESLEVGYRLSPRGESMLSTFE